jgi:thiamine pyrophosphokinase
MKTEKAILVLNGKNFYRKGFLTALKNKADLVIAVDGGICHLEDLEVPPVIHIGDMDSSAPGVKVFVKDTIIFPADKDRSDFFLALDHAYKNKVGEVYVFAATGGRSDHFISNYETAVYYASKGMKITFSGEEEEICFLPCIAPDGYEFKFPAGSTVSVFAGSDECRGVTLEGFKYGLKNEVLCRNIPLGLSNVCTDKMQSIRFESGVLVLIYNKSKV